MFHATRDEEYDTGHQASSNTEYKIFLFGNLLSATSQIGTCDRNCNVNCAAIFPCVNVAYKYCASASTRSVIASTNGIRLILVPGNLNDIFCLWILT